MSYDPNPELNYQDTARREILLSAMRCVCTDREQQYGNVRDNFAEIAHYWSVYLGENILPEDVGLMMALLKIARIQTGTFKADSFVDACGYIACAAEIAEKGR